MKKLLVMAVMAVVISTTVMADVTWTPVATEVVVNDAVYIEYTGWDYGPMEMFIEYYRKVEVWVPDYCTEREELILLYEHIVEE